MPLMVTHHLQKEPRSGVCFTSPDDLPPSFGRITPDLQHNPTASTQSTISFSRWRGHEFCLCYQSRSFYFWVYFSLMSKNQIQLSKKLSQYLIKILISWFIWKWFQVIYVYLNTTERVIFFGTFKFLLSIICTQQKY